MRGLTARVRWATLSGLCVLGAAGTASARERLAVLVIADQAPELADDLTEVVIADLAEHRDRELVGMRELRTRLADVLPAGGLAACVDDAACLARLGAAAGAAEAVIAKVSARSDGYQLALVLADLGTGKGEAQAEAAVPPGFTHLVTAVRAGLIELFAPRPEDARPPPAVAAPVTAAPVTAAPVAALAPVATPTLVARDTGARRVPRWVPYAGVVATALAAVSFSAAAVTGIIAIQEPSGSTRAMAMADLGRREGYATAANGLLAAGCVLTIAAGAAFTWWWRGARGR
jgi:hypothetical protein